MQAVDERVPGDVSAAAFWLVAGAIHPDAELTLRDVGVNPTRRAVIDLLRSMGADIEERPPTRPAADDGVGEPMADLVVRSSRAPRRSTSARPTWPRRSTRSRSCASPRPLADGHDHASAAPASCATRNRTGSPGSRPACARSARGSRSTATTSASTAAPRLRGAATDSLDDHRLAMTFAIAGLVAAGDDHDRAARVGRDLLSRLLRRPRKGASMTKRVVLIGHPVAHSLSGAMQQAAFDSLGIDATYELWDRAADRAGRRRSPSCATTSSWAPT